MWTTPQRHHFDVFAAEIARSIAGNPNDLLDPKYVTSALRVGGQWLSLARFGGYGPPYKKVGRFIRYRRGDLIKWLHSRAALAAAPQSLKLKPPSSQQKLQPKRAAAG